VTLVERSLEDLRRMQKYDRVDEKPFEAVAALSELTERAYELLARPIVRQATPEWLAKLLRETHPLRVQRWALSDYNPWLAMLGAPAAMVRANRHPRSEGNAWLPAERFVSDATVAVLDLFRDLRDATAEALFFQVYGNMLTLNVADQRREIKRATRFDPRALPAVRQVLDDVEAGGAVDGIVRIGLLVAKAGGGRRKLSSMERVRELIAPAHLLDGISEDEFRRLMHEETIIVEFEPKRAQRALPGLLRSAADRRQAHQLLDAMEHDIKLDDRQRTLVGELRALLPMPAGSATRRLAQPPKRGERGTKRARSAQTRGRQA
jgi:hypothetical protein